ncbi:MAG TPA: DUF2520 domain-containing protein [Phycisphaerales bacterium]|nr:DUF2520 domain-containing protein [Phycisphaerales bacterium]
MSGKADISIVGCGKVGTALGVLLARAGYRIAAVADHDDSAARTAAERIGGSARVCPPAEAAAGQIVLLTVPDDAIAAVCSQLAGERAFRPGAIVAHCSGALGSDALSPARALGCLVASCHPLQTFPTVDAAVAKLPGAYFFLEGDEPAVEALRAAATDVGGKCMRIAPEAKALYHAAAIVASNYLVTLMDAAVALAGHAGIAERDALSALEPLVRATVDNVFSLGPAEALTGPVARGDAQTVRRHQQAIAQVDETLRAMYDMLADRTADLARRKRSPNDKTKTSQRKR